MDDYEKFLKDVEAGKVKLHTAQKTVAIGESNAEGHVFVLGGTNAGIWMLPGGTFSVGGAPKLTEEDAVQEYNLQNSTNLGLDHIRKYFIPWYKKQRQIVAVVPSRTTPGETYTITRGQNGELICDPKCTGFRYRRTCWHIEAIEEAESGPDSR